MITCFNGQLTLQTASIKQLSRFFGTLTLLLSCYCAFARAESTDNNLPLLGDRISSVVSPEKEKLLGQAWLRALRSKAPLMYDPLVMRYLRNITRRLANGSELSDKHLSIVLIDSPAINAFAVPGGVIGINTGLFLHSKTEGELAGVIAHELAHLSQRHFARTIEEAKKDQWIQGAALLASVLLIATSDSDTGYAALATTQAAAVQSRLRFSRRNEREADRLAMSTMANADIDPRSIGNFFEKLQKAHQYSGEKPPEYLLTHPVTESRVSDARGRAAKYASKYYPENTDFYLIKARMEARYTTDIDGSIKQHKDRLENSSTIQQLMTHYRLINLLINAQRYNEAEKQLKALINKAPKNLLLRLTHAQIKMANKDFASAVNILRSLYVTQPSDFTLNLIYLEALLGNHQEKTALKLLEKLKTQYPQSPELWALLERAYGKTHDIIGVHLARTEHLFLNGKPDEAIEQLEFALALTDNDFPLTSKIEHRIQAINKSKHALRL
ncbi:MAG: M48 family metalloprotease [Gammaproteobacteria bacterium]|nr:M48 family metalloprotease [Gammaproteobacteria bacterium]